MSKQKNTTTEFFIAARTVGFIVYEKHADGYIRAWHPCTIGEEAAKLLHADLQMHGYAPFFHGPSYIEPDVIADAYEIAVRTKPLLPDVDGAWEIALRIATEKPWSGKYSDGFDIPF